LTTVSNIFSQILTCIQASISRQWRCCRSNHGTWYALGWSWNSKGKHAGVIAVGCAWLLVYMTQTPLLRFTVGLLYRLLYSTL